ncbi:MAG: hypothetical protein ETSY1_35245 [Candidatus Entotheonella factor]|uniref:UGSC-like domain-containing protein n=1 Tax=Entotheonella factor TaxID=1429438 RepID=W4L8F2_ENTF1|nr:hypothetical protein [Candidatus Entotheonella palauensis]ETW94348.1 MAG: hypothetical protein ETSY1_35245 [Candidatus Entotheonella factor]
MATMRILDPTAKRQAESRTLVPFAAENHRIGILHNHSPHFNRLAEALPQALKTQMQAKTVETHTKARYSSGAPQAMLATLSADYDFAITGLAA